MDKLIIPKVIKISEVDNGVELLTTKFSDSKKGSEIFAFKQIL